jgi:hypothetical protein
VSPSCSLLLYDWREERERRTRRQRAPAKLRFSTRRVKPAAAVIRLCACYYFICVFFESFSSMCFLEEREREREREGKTKKKGRSRARLFFLNLKRLLFNVTNACALFLLYTSYSLSLFISSQRKKTKQDLYFRRFRVAVKFEER